MIGHIIDRFFNWMEFEPAIGIMMVVAAIVLFVKAYHKDENFQPATLWEWIRRLIEAASVALLFLGLHSSCRLNCLLILNSLLFQDKA